MLIICFMVHLVFFQAFTRHVMFYLTFQAIYFFNLFNLGTMCLGTPSMVEQMVHFSDTNTPLTIFEFAQTNLVAQVSFHFCYHNSFHNLSFLGVVSCIKLNDKPIRASRVLGLGGRGREKLEDATKLATIEVSLLMLHHSLKKKSFNFKF